MSARHTLGVTGDAGCGKSTVLNWLSARGAATIDADAVVHRLLATDREAVGLVAARFGEEVRGPDGTIHRPSLAAIVFADTAALADLEAILHPRVERVVVEWLAQVPPDTPAAAVEAVKLVESGLHERLDALWLVVCDRAERRRRLAGRGWSAEEIDRRLAADSPFLPKLRLATRVIDNSGSTSATSAQLERAWRHLLGCSPEEA